MHSSTRSKTARSGRRSTLIAGLVLIVTALGLPTLPVSAAPVTTTVITDGPSCSAAGGIYGEYNLFCDFFDRLFVHSGRVLELRASEALRGVTARSASVDGTLLVGVHTTVIDDLTNTGDIRLVSRAGLRARGGTMANGGTITVAAASLLELFPSPRLLNTGLVEVLAGGRLLQTSDATVDNAGRIAVACGGTYEVGDRYTGTAPEYAPCTPTVTIAQAAGTSDPTNGPDVRFDVVFSRAVTGFDSDDVVFDGTASPGEVSVEPVDGRGGFTVVARPTGEPGTLSASVRAGAAQADGVDSTASPSTGDRSVFYDGTAPVVTSSVPSRPAGQVLRVAGSVTDALPVTVAAVVRDQGGATATAQISTPGGDDEPYVVELDVSALQDGPLELALQAVDEARNTALQSSFATKDTTAPAVTAELSPDPLTRATASELRVSGQVADVSPATVTVTITDTSRTSLDAPVVRLSDGRYRAAVDGSLLASGPVTARVTATDAAGLTTTVSDTVTLVDPPGQPRDVSAAPGDGRAAVSWSPPERDGGGTVTSYTVTAVDTGGLGRGGQTCTWSSGPLTCTVEGLVNGVTYVFDVSASNTAGTGSASSQTAASTATPQRPASTTPRPASAATRPSPPLGVRAESGDASVMVSWSAPLSDGGSRITRYVATSQDGRSCVLEVAAEQDPLACRVTGLTDGQPYTFTVTATNRIGTSDPSQASPPVTRQAVASPDPTAGRFHPVVPARVLDTRTAGRPVVAGADRLLRLTGLAGLPPSGVSAVVLNVTVTQPSGRGDLQVYPAGARPTARTSNLNYDRGQTVPVQVLTGVGRDGEVALSVGSGTSHVVVDVLGWYGDEADTEAGSSGYTALAPQRLIDTRTQRDPVVAGADRLVQVAGLAEVPADATAVVLNATVLGSSGIADVQLFPAGQRPQVRTSNLNVRPGQTRANAVTSPLGDGRVAISVSAGSVHVVLDVLGYYSPSSRGRFVALTPARVLDTRETSPLRAGADRSLAIGGTAGVPADAAAAVLSVTGTGASGPVDLQLYPTGRRPGARTSTVNFRPGEAVANSAIAGLTDGRTELSLSSGSAAVVVDVLGYMTSG